MRERKRPIVRGNRNERNTRKEERKEVELMERRSMREGLVKIKR